MSTHSPETWKGLILYIPFAVVYNLSPKRLKRWLAKKYDKMDSE